MTETNVFSTFEEMNLQAELLKGIHNSGLQSPTDLQQRSILPIIKGGDYVVQTPVSSDRIAVLSISALQVVDQSNMSTQVIILSPTRESALQTMTTLTSFGASTKVQVLAAIDKPTSNDTSRLEAGVHIVCGLPGRVLTLIDRFSMKTENVNMLVLNEPDEMILHKNSDVVYEIYGHLKSTTQVVLMPNVMNKDVDAMIEKLMKNPVKILTHNARYLDGVDQYYSVNDPKTKYSVLKDITDHHTLSFVIVYCNSEATVEEVYAKYGADGVPTTYIHSGTDQQTRSMRLVSFKSGQHRILITTDVLAGSPDVEVGKLVINYDMPVDPETYLLRVGRTSRIGRTGKAVSLTESVAAIQAIEEYHSTKIIALENIDIRM
ncbi:hypothetical protein SAMD00019534_003140 [Acytostelium subglobosum LB1]|uniref:hypothetical protein n=1 Tax=Acytostelium subglobosum LB1 TaxID=1410327 RepID=UPI000644943C|nr:hypothetical protein SAMD00019534_003140 [Acytostelium subglobosum LB1]GAM17139.1 hypothetical protein SAMD00019534_003140 [Acytostelium subglobosum LB1]|eukprot:XP_012759201.1 hypothetical protein SAMD00019534_003140 [Acytostelium subglobosum LB1]